MEPSLASWALCVDEDPTLGRLLSHALATHGLRVVRCTGVVEALQSLELAPRLALVDLRLPDGDGLEVVRALHLRWPASPTIVVTADDRPTRVLAALRAGACGYLLKEDLALRLSWVLSEALRGALPMSTRAADAVRRHLQDAPTPVAAGVSLTLAETEILTGLALGLSYAQCALRGGISINTVRSHVRAIYRKLEVGSKTEAVLTAMRLGLISP